MKRIKLAGKLGYGKVALIDDSDFQKLNRFRWRLRGGYVFRTDGLKEQSMHRMIKGILRGFEMDHRNGDPLDNRKKNLRFCTRQQNAMNKKRRSDNTNRFKGVWSNKTKLNPWSAKIKISGKQIHLGCFATEEEAARSYNKAAKNLFSKFAILNFIPG